MSQQFHRPYRARPYGGPRGTFRGGSRAYPVSRVTRKAPGPLGPVLSSSVVEELDLETCSLDQAKIINQRVVSTYNLMGKSSTTILVPGAPPLYTPLLQPRQLKDDAGGEYFREENAARFPKHAMEPAVKSLFASHSMFDTSDIDVFACGSTLGSLIRLILSESQDFSLVVHIVGHTAFFLRRDQSPTELIEDVVGFGHAFPEAYTTWEADVKRSSSHQRVVAYEFGGLKFLLRYESDGYIDDGKTKSSRTAGKPTSAPIEEMLSGLLTEDTGTALANQGVEKRGHMVEQSKVFDLKTRSVRKRDEDIIEGELPRLWARQISKFILAFHRSGTFEEIRVQDVKARVQAWEAQSAPSLQRLAGLIGRIIVLAGQQPHRKIEVRGTEAGKVSFHAVDDDEWSALPPFLENAWVTSGVSSHDEDEYSETGSHQAPRSGRSSEITCNGGDYVAQDYDDGNESENGSLDYTACSAEDCGYCGRCSY